MTLSEYWESIYKNQGLEPIDLDHNNKTHVDTIKIAAKQEFHNTSQKHLIIPWPLVPNP